VRRQRIITESTIRCDGGFTFAESPEVEAPEARIIWHADLDPGTLSAVARRTDPDDPDGVSPDRLARWLTIARDEQGAEHAVLSDGWHHIRIDLEAGTLSGGPVVLDYRLWGMRHVRAKILPLRRFVHLCTEGRFSRTLFPADPAVARLITALRVHDALSAGATQREVAEILVGVEQARFDWNGASDSLRSRVRRLVKEARRLAAGGYRSLLRGSRSIPRGTAQGD
jgi:hypothetical protein